MIYFEVPFQYLFKEYVAFVRRHSSLPFIVSIKGPNQLMVPESFTLQDLALDVDPFQYRYPGLVEQLSEAIKSYCREHSLGF